MIADAAVTPEQAYLRGLRPVHVRYATDAADPVDVEFVRRGRVVRRLPGPPSGEVRWRPRRAPGGRYVVRVDGERAGAFTLRGHKYPIRGPHYDRGGIGAFGQPRSGGRTHEGYDVNADCGVPVAAARAGRVLRSEYDPVLHGHFVVVRGARQHRTYRYSHLLPGVRVQVGDRVRTGQWLGRIGDTGNARYVGCHLHFELRVRGTPVDPAPALHRWDTWS